MEKLKHRFAKAALNEAVKQSFRDEAYLCREEKRLRKSSEDNPLFPWTVHQAGNIFFQTRNDADRRLTRKILQLQAEVRSQTTPRHSTNTEDIDAHMPHYTSPHLSDGSDLCEETWFDAVEGFQCSGLEHGRHT